MTMSKEDDDMDLRVMSIIEGRSNQVSLYRRMLDGKTKRRAKWEIYHV